jgi:hypothetical protein
VSGVQPHVRTGARCGGTILGYPLEQIQEEVAFIAYHFHWSHAEIMELEHRERRHWVSEISAINRLANGDAA